MGSFILILLTVLLVGALHPSKGNEEVPFAQNFRVTYGFEHVTVLDQGNEVQLLINQSLGCGFTSKQIFGSGHFRMRMKIPSKNSTGIITTFYLTSNLANQSGNDNDRDELDFEFLGSGGMPYTLSTNVFVDDQGQREQQFHLWFDPTVDFHTYDILWNQYQIVFFVDETPIRVFKNNTALGVNYPSQFMQIQASVWNSTNWQGLVDWSQGPFTAYYQGFNINGCIYRNSSSQDCYSPDYYWNTLEYRQLNPDQQQKLEEVRKKYMSYDYCSWNSKNHTECQVNL